MQGMNKTRATEGSQLDEVWTSKTYARTFFFVEEGGLCSSISAYDLHYFRARLTFCGFGNTTCRVFPFDTSVRLVLASDNLRTSALGLRYLLRAGRDGFDSGTVLLPLFSSRLAL